MHILFCALCVLGFSRLLAEEIKLLHTVSSPADDSVHLIPSNRSFTAVILQYDVRAEDDVAFCFHLTLIETQSRYAEKCFDVNTKTVTINEVGKGDYALTSFLREFSSLTRTATSIIPETIKLKQFKVK